MRNGWIAQYLTIVEWHSKSWLQIWKNSWNLAWSFLGQRQSKHTLPGSRLVIKTEDGGNLRERWAFLYAESHTMSKKDLPSIKLLSNNGIMCTKKAFKIFIKWIKQKMGLWSWIHPKPGLKVAGKTISFCLARIPMKVICWKGIGLKNACFAQNGWIASRNVLNTYIGLFIQASLCPLSTNLIIEEVISVLANTVISAKLRAWYGIGFTSTRKVTEALLIKELRPTLNIQEKSFELKLFD